MISVNNLGMNFGEQILFENVGFQLNRGNRYGLVGANGSGKSTLLKMLSGDVIPEKGEINISSALRLGVLKQEQFRYENNRILDVVLMGRAALWSALDEKARLSESTHVSDEVGKRLAELEMIISDYNGYQAESEASELLAGLGIGQHQLFQALNTLSGGYKLRVLLAQCLFSDPDFLLLDEPTNHLDLSSIVWLEEHLSHFSGTSLIISHDQYFINRISTHIMDIDYETIKIYPGNYTRYLESKELEKSQKEAEIIKQEKKKEELQHFVDRFKAKATKARQANSKAKQLYKFEEIQIKRSSRLSPNFDLKIIRPSGKTTFTVKNLSKSFDDKEVIKEMTTIFERGQKTAVIGPNGIGKSTFLKILAGELTPSSGGAEPGYEVSIGYFPQDHQDLIPKGTTPYEWLYSYAPGETIGVIRGILGRVLIQGDDVHKATESLSGGESARLIFAKLMLQKPNLLLLDEPTNHMDIESLEALSQVLKKYEGSIIFVSHDRRFINSFATSILELTTDGFDFFSGGYREYIEKQGLDYLDRTGSNIAANQKKKNSTKKENREWRENRKEVGRLERRVKKIEAQISTTERKIASIDEELAGESSYDKKNSQRLEQILEEKKNLENTLEGTVNQWEEAQSNLDTYSKGESSTI